MRLTALAIVLLGAPAAQAQPAPETFPRAVVQFLDAELPKMDRAIAERDRTFFPDSLVRSRKFLQSWAQGEREVALSTYPMCADAMTEYLIVGLCKVVPANAICEPATFVPKFERNLADCRAAAH